MLSTQQVGAALFLAVLATVHCKQRPSSAAKIAQGQADDTSNPSAIGLVLADDSGNPKGICTGAIIRDDLVLTAAHCFTEVSATVAWVIKTFPADKDQAKSLSLAQSQAVTVMPGYPTNGGEAPDLTYLGKDVAIAVFPPQSFDPSLVASRAAQGAKVGDRVTLVGYGQNSLQTPTNSNAEHRRYVGHNTIDSILPPFANGLVLKATLDTPNAAVVGKGDSGGALWSDAQPPQILGIASSQLNCIGIPADCAMTANKPEAISYYANIDDPQIKAFIDAVTADEHPNAQSGHPQQ